MKDFYYCILPKSVAKERGIMNYMTGKPCNKGVVYNRLVSNCSCQCVPCRDERAEMIRQDKKKNPQKYKDKTRKRYEENKEDVKAYMKTRYYSDREHEIERKRIYAALNPHLSREKKVKRRLAKFERTINKNCELTELVMIEATDLCLKREQMHGFEWHNDHAIPLRGKKVSGLHVGWNLQVIPAWHNLSKGNRMIYTEDLEWMRQ